MDELYKYDDSVIGGPYVPPLGSKWCSNKGNNADNMSIETEVPFSCMINLIKNYAYCGESISDDKVQAAYEAFVDVTGYKTADLNAAFNTIMETNEALLNFNVFYIFTPIFILILLAVWFMVGFSWINWVVGLFISGVAFIVLYGFAVFYRIQVQDYLDSQNNKLHGYVDTAQKNLENSVAYWPQGLFAVACAVTSDDWKCNEPTTFDIDGGEQDTLSKKNIHHRKRKVNKN